MNQENPRPNKMRKYLFMILALALILFFIFKKGSSQVLVYNPYGNEIQVKLDEGNKVFTFAAKEHREIAIKSGPHHLRISLNGKMIFDEEIFISDADVAKGAFLNLTHENLIVYSQVFGNNAFQKNSSVYQSYQNDGFEIFPASQLIVARVWDYEIYEKMPESIEVLVKENQNRYFETPASEERKKLFTESNFTIYMNEMSED